MIVHRVFVYIDWTITVLALVSNFLALQAVIASRFNLIGYRRVMLSLLVSDIYICSVRIVVSALAEYYTTSVDVDTGDSFITPGVVQVCSASLLRSALALGICTNLLNLCGMSIDHYIGIVYPLRYRYIMSKWIFRNSVFIFWTCSFCFAFADIFIASGVFFGKEVPNTSYDPESPAVINYLAQKSCANSNNNNNNFNTNNHAALMDLFSSPSTSAVGMTIAPSIAAVTTTATTLLPALVVAKIPQQKLKPKINSYKMTKKKASGKKKSKALEPTLLQVEQVSLNLSISDADKLLDFIDEAIRLELDRRRMMTVATDDEVNRSANGERKCDDIGHLYKTFSSIHRQSLISRDWCKYLNANKVWSESLMVLWTMSSFIFMIVVYHKTFRQCHPDERQVFVQSRRSIRRLAIATAWLVAVFAFCWLPQMLFEIGMFAMAFFNNNPTIDSESLLLVHRILHAIFHLGPLLDPIIYVSRVPPVRRVVEKRLAHIFPSLFPYLRPSYFSDYRSSQMCSVSIQSNATGTSQMRRTFSERCSGNGPRIISPQIIITPIFEDSSFSSQQTPTTASHLLHQHENKLIVTASYTILRDAYSNHQLASGNTGDGRVRKSASAMF